MATTDLAKHTVTASSCILPTARHRYLTIDQRRTVGCESTIASHLALKLEENHVRLHVPRTDRVVISLVTLLVLSTAPAAAQTPPAPSESTASISRDAFRQQLLQTFPMEQPARQGGTLVVGDQGDISTVNGILSADAQSFLITGAIFETLVGGSPIDGQIVPALADSWEISADGLTYTFHLNQNAKWHDGTDLTAEDVAFSFGAVLDPNTGSLYTTTVNDAVASYRVIDPDTFEITARDRLVSFLYDAPGTVAIMPKHIWQSVGLESWSVDGGSTGLEPERVVGTGPFRFVEWVQGDHVTIGKNPDYYEVVPSIDQLIYRTLPDENAAVQSLITGDSDVLQIIPPAQVEAVEQTGNHSVSVYDLLDLTFFAFNLDPDQSPLFQDPKVRQALFQAIDRDTITETIFLGYGEAAIGTQPKLAPAYAPDRITTQYPFDPEAARALFAEAGWQLNDDDVLERDGTEFEFDMLLAEGSATVDSLATYMQDAWRQVGVRMNIETTQGGALLERLNARQFEMMLLAFTMSPDGGQGALFSCGAYTTGFNFMRYCNPRYDELEEQQRREFDRTRRIDLMIEQTNIVWSDLPIAPIRFGVGRTGYSNRIHNFYPNGYGFLWSLPYIWLDEE